MPEIYLRRFPMNMETSNAKVYDEVELERIRRELQTMSLSDNELFLVLMRDTKLFSHVLSVVLGEEMTVDGEISMVETNKEIRLRTLGYRSVYLDAYARDSEGNVYHIEMENAPSRMPVKRVRYYCGASDVYSVRPGIEYEEMPRSIHMIFAKGDILKSGKAVTKVMRMTDDGKEYGDESYIYHINMLAIAEGELGRLVRSMLEPNPEKVEDSTVRGVLKSAKGGDSTVREICDIKNVLSRQEQEAFFAAGKAEGIAEGKAEGIAEERSKLVRNAIQRGNSKDAISSMLAISIEEIDAIVNKIELK